MDHTATVHKDCSLEFCPICVGGLFLCSVCGLLEGSLTTECPGVPSASHGDAVYAGSEDFIGGQWRPQSVWHRRHKRNPEDGGD